MYYYYTYNYAFPEERLADHFEIFTKMTTKKFSPVCAP